MDRSGVSHDGVGTDFHETSVLASQRFNSKNMVVTFFIMKKTGTLRFSSVLEIYSRILIKVVDNTKSLSIKKPLRSSSTV